ncbi:CpaF family protein [Micromonospora sp. NPDC000089]|uniref:CpaF family protein n=1 Tax=unclassified Micromonospora TaxID=2617518 RepID=UPI00368AA1F8
MSLTDRLAQRYPDHDSGGRSRNSGTVTVSNGSSAAALRLRVHRELLDILGPQLYDNRTADAVLEQKVRDTVNDVLARDGSPLAVADSARIAAELLDEILGHGPIEPLLRDPDVTEIMVNGPDQIFVERFGRIHRVEATFVDEQHLRRVIDRIVSRVGRRVDESSPMVDARLPDGSRVNVVLPPVALDGSMLTVRKFAHEALTANDLVGYGTFTPEVAQFLYACVRGRLDIVISGGTGSGKTTTLNVLSSFLPPDERIVTIEDAAELQLRQNHVLRLESRPANIEGRGEITIRDLVRNALRMRPDRIVIGEVRDGAALDLLQAMNTGHNGSLTTVHANAPRDSVARLETMCLMAGLELPVRAIREQIASAVDLVVHQSRLRDGTRRVTHVTEVLGIEGEVVTMQDLFVFDHRAGYDADGRHQGTLRWTGLRPRLLDTLADAGVPVPAGLFEGSPW